MVMARIALCLSALLVAILLVHAIYKGDAKPEYAAM